MATIQCKVCGRECDSIGPGDDCCSAYCEGVADGEDTHADAPWHYVPDVATPGRGRVVCADETIAEDVSADDARRIVAKGPAGSPLLSALAVFLAAVERVDPLARGFAAVVVPSDTWRELRDAAGLVADKRTESDPPKRVQLKSPAPGADKA